MEKIDWSIVTKENVIQAVRIFTEDNSEYPKPKSTFLLFENL